MYVYETVINWIETNHQKAARSAKIIFGLVFLGKKNREGSIIDNLVTFERNIGVVRHNKIALHEVTLLNRSS